MAAPFYNAIKGTTSGTPGTGAFTPNAASTGYRAWSSVPTGWIGLVCFDDGTARELTYSYWNGTTLSRASTQVFWSTTGSALALTSAATATMANDAKEVQPHLGGTPWCYAKANNASALATVGMPSLTPNGTAASVAPATTNALTEYHRVSHTSATTANAAAGVYAATGWVVSSSAAGRGGWEYVARFGATTLPTSPRLIAGVSDNGSVLAGEPSALTSKYACFAKDSTDTNIQLLVNSGVSTGTKTDTGIPLVANGLYEASVWTEQGSLTVYGLLIRLDTGAIWYGSTSTDVPANGSIMGPYLLGTLSATTGTAFVMNTISIALRHGS